MNTQYLHEPIIFTYEFDGSSDLQFDCDDVFERFADTYEGQYYWDAPSQYAGKPIIIHVTLSGETHTYYDSTVRITSCKRRTFEKIYDLAWICADPKDLKNLTFRVSCVGNS
jgi:hypothetical protein